MSIPSTYNPYLPSRFKVNQSIAIDYLSRCDACRETQKKKIRHPFNDNNDVILCVNCCCAAIEKKIRINENVNET